METYHEPSGSCCEQEKMEGVRLVVLNLPEDEGEGLGFRLSRTLWDPYPWVRDVKEDSRADVAGLKMGDCLLQADGKDLLGLPVGQVAGLIRGDGAGRGVSLLVWNCGVDPTDDPELLWSGGGGSRGERSRRALGVCVRALACCVCGATSRGTRTCLRSHLYCNACWDRLERCALCREPLPDTDSPYSRNLVAEQVFEAIATEYELKETLQKPQRTISAYSSPNRSPNLSPAFNRKCLPTYRKKTVKNEISSSDPNIHRSVNEGVKKDLKTTNKNTVTNTGNTEHKCQCQNKGARSQLPQIKVENADGLRNDNECHISSKYHNVQHKLVARLRQACSLADLQNSLMHNCETSRSMNSLNKCNEQNVSSSLDNLKNAGNISCDTPVFVLPATPIYVLSCEHDAN